jgi:hypothetical protein
MTTSSYKLYSNRSISETIWAPQNRGEGYLTGTRVTGRLYQKNPASAQTDDRPAPCVWRDLSGVMGEVYPKNRYRTQRVGGVAQPKNGEGHDRSPSGSVSVYVARSSVLTQCETRGPR